MCWASSLSWGDLLFRRGHLTEHLTWREGVDRPRRATRSALTDRRSVLPGGWYPAKHVAGERHTAYGRERQVRSHQRLARRRKLTQETDPDADRLLGVVVECV